jgi:hypothetical protein
MKKVRYAASVLGALGVVPALGVTAHAANATTDAPASTGKTVSLATATAAPAAPACDARSGSSTKGHFTGIIFYSRDIGCIGDVFGDVTGTTATGLWMRVRSYTNGHLISSRFNKHGHIHANSVSWSSTPRTTGIQQVCEAIVSAQTPTHVIYGPVCETTGFQ